jgi:hypothetical protein
MTLKSIDLSRFTESETTGPVILARREPESDPNPRLVIRQAGPAVAFSRDRLRLPLRSVLPDAPAGARRRPVTLYGESNGN